MQRIRNCNQHGFTLIEIIGVLAIMSIMAATIAPSAIQMITSSKQTSEDKALAAITTAIDLYAQTQRTIPDQNTWATDLAPLLNTSPAKVSQNANNGNRYYVYPNDFLATGSTLPYNQNQTIAATKPLHAKIMVISNLDSSTPLSSNPNQKLLFPSPSTSNAMQPQDFDDLWNQTGAYAATTHQFHEDNLLKIARIDLSTSFAQSSFTNQDTNPIAIAIDGYANNPVVINNGTPLTLYLIKNTLVSLFSDTAGNNVYNKQSVIPPTMTDVYAQGWSTNGPANGVNNNNNNNNNGTGPNGGSTSIPSLTSTPGGTTTVTSPTAMATQQSNCTSNGNYNLSVTNNNANDYLIFAGQSSGSFQPTNPDKVSKKKNGNAGTATVSIPGCSVVLFSTDKKTAPLYLFYMPNNNVNFTIP